MLSASFELTEEERDAFLHDDDDLTVWMDRLESDDPVERVVAKSVLAIIFAFPTDRRVQL